MIYIIERAVGLKSEDTWVFELFFQILSGKLFKPAKPQWKWDCLPMSQNGSEIILNDICESA